MSKVMELINQIFENGLDNDRRVMALLRRYIVNQSEENRRILSRIVTPGIILNKFVSKPFKRVVELGDGLIRFALTELGLSVGFNSNEPHCLMAGRTGCGKTVLLTLMLSQAIVHGSRVWLFTKAKDSRNLLKCSKEILVVDFRNQVKFNPLLPPPGLDYGFWVNCFADIFIQAFGLYDGTKNFLIENLNYLFSQNETPAINDLFRLVKSQKHPVYSRTARYQESAFNRLSGITSGSLGRTLNYPCCRLEDLAQRNVIFEIHGLTSEQQVFVVNILVTWLFYYQLNYDNTNHHFVGIDDANVVFDKAFDYRPDRGQPIISHLLSTVRKSKIIIIVCSQIPCQLGSSIHSNAFTKIMFSLGNGQDIDFMARSMGIKDFAQLQYCYQLGEREIVVKFAGRYQEPFLAYIPEIDIFNSEVSDEEIGRNNERILFSITLIGSSEAPNEVLETSAPDKSERDKATTEERAFLWDIYNRPYISITERYRTIDLGG